MKPIIKAHGNVFSSKGWEAPEELTQTNAHKHRVPLPWLSEAGSGRAGLTRCHCCGYLGSLKWTPRLVRLSSLCSECQRTASCLASTASTCCRTALTCRAWRCPAGWTKRQCPWSSPMRPAFISPVAWARASAHRSSNSSAPSPSGPSRRTAQLSPLGPWAPGPPAPTRPITQGSSRKSPANSSQRPVGRPRGASECGTFCLELYIWQITKQQFMPRVNSRNGRPVSTVGDKLEIHRIHPKYKFLNYKFSHNSNQIPHIHKLYLSL